MHLQSPDSNSDPFLQMGTLLYSRYHSMNILISDKPGQAQKLPNQQQLLVKICIQGSADNVRLVCIQLTSDSELEFNFQFRCNDMEFRRIKELQKFSIQFREYPEAILRNFQRLGERGKYEANFVIFSQTEGKLEIIRKSEFKDDQIMEFNFSRSTEEHIQASIQSRYDKMRKQYSDKVRRFEQYREIIRSKNPSLMMHIDKALKGKK